jgi:ubiquitin-protein ligase
MMRESPRVRRLRTDLRALEAMKADSTILDFVAYGDPPEQYMIQFFGNGLTRNPEDNRVVIAQKHEVKIGLGASYPRVMPEMQWVSPFFHPNVSGSGAVCLGGYGTYWVPSLNLDELCEMLWEMIRYQNYDITSPYNRDAADWARYQQEYKFPVDNRPIRDKVAVVEPQLPPPLVKSTGDVLFLGNVETDPAADVGPGSSDDILIIE